MRYTNTTNESIKARVEKELDRNPLLTAKPLCKILGLSFKKYGGYLRYLKYKWKRDSENEVGLKGAILKNWQGWVYCPPSVDIQNAVNCGWRQTKSRNHYLLWKSKLGRLEMHPGTRKIKVSIKKPCSQGKAFQLLADGFFRSGLIYEIELFDRFVNSLRFKRATWIIPFSERLPYIKIRDFKDSNGMIIKMGDRSHPHALEIDFAYPDWGEKSEATMHKLNKTFEKLLTPKTVQKGATSYIR